MCRRGLHLATPFLGLEVIATHLGHQQFVLGPHLVEATGGGLLGLRLQLGHAVGLGNGGFQSGFLVGELTQIVTQTLGRGGILPQCLLLVTGGGADSID